VGLRKLSLLVLLALLAASCEQEKTGPRYGTEPARKQPPLTFAVHPLHNPAKLLAAYQPLIDYLNANLEEERIVLEASRDYRVFEEKYTARKPAFLLPNPWQTQQAKAGYQVIAMAGDPADFKGLILVRKDSGIQHPADLKGRAISYPAATALAACIMPQYFLHRHGINVLRDIDNRYVGSQESAIMNAYLGKTAAGATWPTPWRAFQREHPREASELRVAWETESLINNSVMVRNDLPAPLKERMRKLLTELHTSEQGRAILAGMEIARFRPANNADYDVVTEYIARFEADVRKVELK
jgi:phosphonate transport system substrate-binding protein